MYLWSSNSLPRCHLPTMCPTRVSQMGVPATTASESASSSATTPFSSSSAVSVTSGDVVCSNTWFSARGNSGHSDRNRLLG